MVPPGLILIIFLFPKFFQTKAKMRKHGYLEINIKYTPNISQMFNAMFPVFILQIFMVLDIQNQQRYQLKVIIAKNKIVQTKKDLDLQTIKFILSLKQNQSRKKKL